MPFAVMRYRPFRCLAFAAALAAAAPPALAQMPGGPPAVGVIVAKKQPVTQVQEFIGRIGAVNRVNIVARVTAQLEETPFTEGSEVKKGDVLYRLERPPFEAQVESSQANIAQYEALLRNATLTTQRAQQLLKTPAGQQSAVDSALAQQQAYAAQLLGAQAQLKTSQINLDYTTITAPIDGKIARNAVTIGNIVGPTSGTLTTIVSQDPMYVTFPVPSRQVLDLNAHYAGKGGFNAVVIRVRLPDGSLYGQTGKLDFIDPSVASSTDTIVLRGTMPNPLAANAKPGDLNARTLVDGEFVTVLVEGVEPIVALGIPRGAVLSDQQGNYVYVVGPDETVSQRRIQLGQSTPAIAMVSAGLDEGERVVVDGIQRVRPGIKVSAAPASPGPADPAKAGQ
ncbi:efflux RND transporter periplasmic adaptor subunit [Labrys wisconsinensis]|uniref:Membrane fusion protein (Multidrug efflux system) n=1 Tax=Labrys wisconsinensis TaxID=425677 RepID=A0ABU0JLA5_9HYPH|nr:efflux RND transporter periplasmic adaptor subunit [Labrys wisconsinensis]MDQ0475069.1 membrane fusion protein (multidrug efflux system) [Labrys wisconsinensis]